MALDLAIQRFAVGDAGDDVDSEIDAIFATLGLPDECEEDRRVAAVLTYLRETAMR